MTQTPGTARTPSNAQTPAVADAAGDTASPSYEEARDELISVVQRLEAGGLSLEESLALWERGEQLATICQRWLDGARARLDSVIAASSGTDDSEDDT